MAIEKISLEDFLGRLKAQGVPRRHLALICPACGTAQSMHSLIAAGAGATEDEVEKYVGFSCVGRWTEAPAADFANKPPKYGGSGCDWTLGGLLGIHELEVATPDGEVHPRFVPATAEQAQALMAQVEATCP